jgi:hypothetical protein
MDESIDVSDTAQLAVFIRVIDMELTEELAALMPMKGTTADLYEEGKKVLNSKMYKAFSS